MNIPTKMLPKKKRQLLKIKASLIENWSERKAWFEQLLEDASLKGYRRACILRDEEIIGDFVWRSSKILVAVPKRMKRDWHPEKFKELKRNGWKIFIVEPHHKEKRALLVICQIKALIEKRECKIQIKGSDEQSVKNREALMNLQERQQKFEVQLVKRKKRVPKKQDYALKENKRSLKPKRWEDLSESTKALFHSEPKPLEHVAKNAKNIIVRKKR